MQNYQARLRDTEKSGHTVLMNKRIFLRNNLKDSLSSYKLYLIL